MVYEEFRMLQQGMNECVRVDLEAVLKADLEAVLESDLESDLEGLPTCINGHHCVSSDDDRLKSLKCLFKTSRCRTCGDIKIQTH